MFKKMVKRALRPISKRIGYRTDLKVQQGMEQVRTALNGQINNTLASLQAANSQEITELQRQIDKLRIDLYFSHLAAGREFTPTKVVELKFPSSAIEMYLSGPAEDRSIIGTISYQDGYYEPHLVVALSRWISNTAICIDIGANIGAISLQLSKIASNGHVYSFEPAAKTFQYLVQNITANDIKNITAYKMGVSDRTQELNLNYINDLSGCSFVLGDGIAAPTNEASTAKRETIYCIAIDDWIAQNNLPNIDFIKLDAEGMELAALRGAENLLRRDRPDLAIEFNPHTNDGFGHGSSRELFDMLTQYWDEIYAIPRNQLDKPVRIIDFDQLMALASAGPGWEDLFCTTHARRRG